MELLGGKIGAGGVRRVRGSPGPTTGIGSPQHVRAVKSPRPSFLCVFPVLPDEHFSQVCHL